MKKIKYLITTLLVMFFAMTSFGCYMISGQKMDKVKGTYKLTSYTYTPSYERREGYTPKTYDYVSGEDYLYEDYLVVTGAGTGYYVHKDVNNAAYSKEVNLSYMYNAEDSSQVEYVIWNDAVSGNSDSRGHKLGIAKNRLNFSLPAFDYTQLFTKKKMRSDDMYVSWEKVDKATDLSYVKNQLGELKEYAYEAYGVRGIYEWEVTTDVETSQAVDNQYQYYFIVVDTANGVTNAKISYALKETPTVRVDETVALTHTAGDWSSMTIGGIVWSIDSNFGTYYYSEVDGLRRQITNRSSDISDASLNELIANEMPAV